MTMLSGVWRVGTVLSFGRDRGGGALPPPPVGLLLVGGDQSADLVLPDAPALVTACARRLSVAATQV